MRNMRRDNGGEPENSPRRASRGLGPFSSGHLTVIVVTFVVVVAFPFAAGAVTGNNVFITDFTSGAHAKVDSTGNLGATVNGGTSGKRADVTPAQQLLTTDAAPSSFLLGNNDVGVLGPQGETGSYECVQIAAPDSGKAAVVNEINFATGTVTAPSSSRSTITVRFYVSPTGSPCTGPVVGQVELTAPGQNIALSLGSGVSIPSAQALYAYALVNTPDFGSGGGGSVYAYGYDVIPGDVGFVAR